MKSVLLAALVGAVAACGGGSGDDQQTPDAALDPHGLMSCSVGSATMCENACNPAPAATGMSCAAQGGQSGQYSGFCNATFIDSDNKKGCCIQTPESTTGGYFLRFLECV